MSGKHLPLRKTQERENCKGVAVVGGRGTESEKADGNHLSVCKMLQVSSPANLELFCVIFKSSLLRPN